MSSPTPVAGTATQSGVVTLTEKQLEVTKAVAAFSAVVDGKGKGGDDHTLAQSLWAYQTIRANRAEYKALGLLDIEDKYSTIRKVSEDSIDINAQRLYSAMYAAITMEVDLAMGLNILKWAKLLITKKSLKNWDALVAKKDLSGLQEWYDDTVDQNDADKEEAADFAVTPSGIAEDIAKILKRYERHDSKTIGDGIRDLRIAMNKFLG